MTTEDKKLSAEEQPEEVAEEAKAEDTNNGAEAKNLDNAIDYEAELQRERQRAKEAEERLALTREKAKKSWEERQRKKSDDVPSDDEADLNRPMTVAEFQTILARERQVLQNQVLQGRITEIAKQYATSDAEAQLIVETHKSRVFPEGMPIEEQVEEVYAIVNRKKLIGERNEALRAAKNAKNVSDNPAGTYRDSNTTTPKASSAGAKAELARLGFTFNPVTQRFEKKTASGKTLVHDPKSGAIRPA